MPFALTAGKLVALLQAVPPETPVVAYETVLGEYASEIDDAFSNLVVEIDGKPTLVFALSTSKHSNQYSLAED